MFGSWISSSKVYPLVFAKVRRQTLPKVVQIARNFQSQYQKINSQSAKDQKYEQGKICTSQIF
jgi:hypothetical protein